MTDYDILVPAGVMAILRREDSARGMAERLGVSEAQVHEWMDVFTIAGALALNSLRAGRKGKPRSLSGSGKGGSCEGTGDPTTFDICDCGDPTTFPLDDVGDPTTFDIDDDLV